MCGPLETVAPLVGDGAVRFGDEAGATLTDVVVTGVFTVVVTVVFTVVVVGMLTVGGGGSFGVVVGGGGGGLTGSVGTVTVGGGGRVGTLGTEVTVVSSPIPGPAASAWLARKPNRSVNPRAAAAFMTY